MTAPTATTTPDVTVHPGDQLTSAERVRYILLLGSLVALGPFTIDLYLPAFPAVASDLMTTHAAIQLTLTATTIGFALGQLIVGPFSDAVGRRWPLLGATVLHIAASIGVACAPSVEWVMAGRVLQGIGAAGGAVVAMAVVRDLFGGQRLVTMLSRLALVNGLAPVIAPVVGSQLLRVIPWRGVFVVLAAYGLVVMLVAAVMLVETLPEHRRGFSKPELKRRYRVLVTDPAFVGVAIVGASAFTALYSYLSASSFVLQDTFGLSAQQFGMAFAVNSVGLVASTQISARLMRRMAPRYVTGIGLAIMTAGGLALWAVDALGGGLLGVLIALFFVVSPVGIVMPTVQVMALVDHPTEAGTAASLVGATNMIVAGAVSPLVSVVGGSAGGMAVVILGALVVGQASLWIVVRRRGSSQVVA